MCMVSPYTANLLPGKENNVDMPEGIEVKVVENTDKLVHFTLPPKPKEGELSDEELGKVAGGDFWETIFRGLGGCDNCQ